MNIVEQQLEAATVEGMERIRIQSVLAEKLLAALLLANGGALVALFTFIGNSAVVLRTGFLWAGFASFIVGLTLALAAFVLAFLSQDRFYLACHHEGERHRASLRNGIVQEDNTDEREAVTAGAQFYISGVALACFSILAFALGSGLSLAGVLPR